MVYQWKLNQNIKLGGENMESDFLEKSSKNFVETKFIKDIINRALLYLQAGIPIHFSGTSGTGKTSLALRLAKKLEQPFILIYGNEDFTSTDLMGNFVGFETNTVKDNFIHSVYKTKEETKRIWVDNRVTTACKHGYILIYDEFTRTPPESNNILLSVLEEQILQLPPVRGDKNYLEVDSDFKAIFTSNPEEYAGVHPTQDALLDRMITINLNGYDLETEMLILRNQTQLNTSMAKNIILIINKLRSYKGFKHLPTLRTAIKLGRVIKTGKIKLSNSNRLEKICIDIMAYDNKTETLVTKVIKNQLKEEG